MRKLPLLGLPLLGLLLLAGCAATPPRLPDVAGADCLAAFASNDAAVARAGVGDADAARIDGFPWLRVDRVLASFRQDITAPAAQGAWLQRLSALDEAARVMEGAALGTPPPARLASCRQQLTDALLRDQPRFEELRARATVPDNYQGLARTLGLYPIAAVFAGQGVAGLQARERPRASVEPGPATRAYASVASDKAAPPPDLASLPRDALGFPLLSPDDLQRIFRQHAPLWLVETASPDDVPGTVQWNADGKPAVAGPATEYRYVSHTRFGHQVLLQLNYMLWFPARSPTRPLDLLAGDFDAVIWRVTLDADGVPLLHDSVHACGCYQLWWPGPRLKPLAVTDDTELPWLAPGPVPARGLAVQLDARTHYVLGVAAAPELSPFPLAVADYDDLRRLPTPQGGERSLFTPDGLLHASARPERFVLWPLGVPSAGAMRQRGHQATAFIGRRHFDDAFGVSRYFERVSGK